MTPKEVEEAKNGFKKAYRDSKDESDKLLQAKLNEIEEGYQRYLTKDNDQYTEQDGQCRCYCPDFINVDR